MRTRFFLALAIASTLGSFLPLQAQPSRRDADMQKRHMREYQRFQRHYQQQIEQFRLDILEKDENLQGHYSESIDSERIYLEASKAYEKLLEKMLLQLPSAKIIQDAVLKIQQDLRKPGQSPAGYREKIGRLKDAQIKLVKLRESLKEEEEVKLAFDELDLLEKKYLSAGRAYDDLMAKALAKHPGAQRIQKELDKPFGQFVREKTRQLNAQPKR